MITINLKAKHFYLIADNLSRNDAKSVYTIITNIKNATNGIGDDDTCDVSVDSNQFLQVFINLSLKPEGQYNRINTEMFTLLEPQINAGVQSGNQEWIDLAPQIVIVRNQNWQVCDDAISNGKSFIVSL